MKAILCAVGVVVVALVSAARADIVVFKNGDRLSGKIETVADGKLTLSTESAGMVTIDMAHVDTFSTDAPIKLQLNDGTVLSQKVNASRGGEVELAGSETIKGQPLALSALAAVNPPEKPKPAWTGNVTGGYVQTTGNSETTNASVDLKLSRRTEDDRTTVSGYYLFGKEKTAGGQEQTSTDKWGVLGKYDYFLTQRFYTFVNASYERDRVANLDARAIGGGGVGYQWFESPEMNFNTDAGLGFMHEQYSNPTRTTNTVVGQLGDHFDRKLTDTLTFLQDLRFYPDLKKPANFKVNASAELRAALTKTIYANFKVIMDHNSEPAAGAKKTDMTYIVGVGVTF
jgi:putative salt-induced outer membrane protein YdiY